MDNGEALTNKNKSVALHMRLHKSPSLANPQHGRNDDKVSYPQSAKGYDGRQRAHSQRLKCETKRLMAKLHHLALH
jgi:hypothetical protein